MTRKATARQPRAEDQPVSMDKDSIKDRRLQEAVDQSRKASTGARANEVRPEPIDKDAIKAKAELDVTRTLDAIADPHRRMKKAVDLIRTADEKVDELTPRMRNLSLSLYLLEGGVMVHEATAVGPVAFYNWTTRALYGDEKPTGDWIRPAKWNEDVRARAKGRGVRLYREAITELPKVSKIVLEHTHIREVAKRYRDAELVKLIEGGMQTEEAGKLAGVGRPRAAQIMSRHRKESGPAA